MTLNDLMALVNAGFTKAEIVAMTAEQPSEQPKEQPKEQPSEQPSFMTDTMFTESKKMFDALGMKMDTLTQAVQKSNMNSGTGTVEETVDSILASIINPPKKEVK